MQAGRDCGHADFHVVFASKAFPCTAVLRLFAQEGLWCDVASGGELHLALDAGFRPERLVLHGNAKSQTELGMALGLGVGLIVVDNFDEIDRLEGLLAERDGGAQRVLLRVTPDVRGRRTRRSRRARPIRSSASRWSRRRRRSRAWTASTG